MFMIFYVLCSIVLSAHIIGYIYFDGSFFALIVGLGIALLCFLLGLYMDYDMYRDHKWIRCLLSIAICGGAILIYGGLFDLYYLDDFVVSSGEVDLGWKYGVFQYSIRGFLLLMFIAITALMPICMYFKRCCGWLNNDWCNGS